MWKTFASSFEVLHCYYSSLCRERQFVELCAFFIGVAASSVVFRVFIPPRGIVMVYTLAIAFIYDNVARIHAE